MPYVIGKYPNLPTTPCIHTSHSSIKNEAISNIIVLCEIATLISMNIPSTKLILDVFMYGSILYILLVLFSCISMMWDDKE